MTPMMKRKCAMLVFLGVVSLPGVASATPGFREVVQDHLALACTPQCILCHRTNAGGGGPELDKAFARALRDEPPVDERLYPYDDFSVGTALDWAADTRLDADGNGVADVDELADGVYPGTDRRFCGEGAIEGPRYGCGARLSPRGSVGGSVGGLAALFALALARFGRRRPALG
jgi:hypothetical protein